MAHNLACEFCSRPISTTRDYQLVEGYERKRDGGGTNALRLRRPKGKWACMFCIDKEAKGIAANQEGLFA
jgi:hypothetical protein